MEPDISPRYRWAALTLIVIAALWRLIYLAANSPLDLAPDEAYYWNWSRQLDWCYHSKGPLVAWLIRLSCELFGDTVLAIRLPAVACGSLLLLGLHTLTRHVYHCDRLALAVVGFAATLPIVATGSMLMTIDAPFTCAWTWALVFGHRAITGQTIGPWVAAGACVMLGLLAKHTMVLWLGSFVLFLAATPAYRGVLLQRGFWILLAMAAIGAAPIVVWNLLHGWVTLEHSQMHVGIDSDAGIHWLGPLQYLGTQFAVLLGFWFLAWACAMWANRPTCETDPSERFLWWMSAPAFVFFGVFSITNGGGEANWPIAAYLSGAVLTAGWLARELENAATWRRRVIQGGAVATATLGLLLIGALHEPIRVQPVFLRLAGPATEQNPTPIRRIDPTARLRGWRRLADEVDRVRGDLERRGIDPVLAGERWTLAAELAFYCDGKPRFVVLGSALGDRDSQFDLWRPNPVRDAEQYHGRSFLIVGLDLERLRDAFDAWEPAQPIAYREGDCLVAAWEVAVGRGLRGWHKMGRTKTD